LHPWIIPADHHIAWGIEAGEACLRTPDIRWVLPNAHLHSLHNTGSFIVPALALTVVVVIVFVTTTAKVFAFS
jgi:hypothetical protein